METQNQADVANSLQVFFNLKMLEQKVNNRTEGMPSHDVSR